MADKAAAPAEKKPEEKKKEEAEKPEEKKEQEAKKPDEKKKDEGRKLEEAKKPDDKKNDENKKPDEKKPDKKEKDETKKPEEVKTPEGKKPDEKKKDDAKKPEDGAKKPEEKDDGKKPDEKKEPGGTEPPVNEAKSAVESALKSVPAAQGGAILALIAKFPPGLNETDSEEDSIDGDGADGDDHEHEGDGQDGGEGKGRAGKDGKDGKAGKDGKDHGKAGKGGGADGSGDGSDTDGSLSARNRRLNRRRSSNPPPGPIGTMFVSNGKWMVKCNVHTRMSMEVEELIDYEAERGKYIRPGGEIRLVRYACVDEGVPVCAEYPDWRRHPELSFVKGCDLPGYRRRRLTRWLSEVCPIQENERFDRFLVRCHAMATKELMTFEEEFEPYQEMFPHVLDKWVALLHLGFLFRRKNMGKARYVDEAKLILELMREECEVLFMKKKLLFYDQPEEEREYSRSQKAWQQRAEELCGSISPI